MLAKPTKAGASSTLTEYGLALAKSAQDPKLEIKNTLAALEEKFDGIHLERERLMAESDTHMKNAATKCELALKLEKISVPISACLLPYAFVDPQSITSPALLSAGIAGVALFSLGAAILIASGHQTSKAFDTLIRANELS